MRRISELRTLRSQAKRVLGNVPATVEQDTFHIIGPDDDPFENCHPGDKVVIMGGDSEGVYRIDEHGQPQPARQWP